MLEANGCKLVHKISKVTQKKNLKRIKKTKFSIPLYLGIVTSLRQMGQNPLMECDCLDKQDANSIEEKWNEN
jgi:hypothetical protein